jgi:hypothetical protein
VVEEPGHQEAYLGTLRPGVYPGPSDEYRVPAGLLWHGRAGLPLRAYRASLRQNVKEGDMTSRQLRATKAFKFHFIQFEIHSLLSSPLLFEAY